VRYQIGIYITDKIIQVKENINNYFPVKTFPLSVHLLQCSTLINECSLLCNDISSEYEDIFGDSTEQLQITRLYNAVFEAKTKMDLIL
jgi:hypothetical protein